MRVHVRSLLTAVLAVAAFLVLPPAQSETPIASAATGDAVLTWSQNAGAAATAACLTPPPGDPFHESRMYAIMHIAIHDALNSIDRRSQPYVFDGPRQPNASPDAAVAAAARTVLVALISQLPSPELMPPSCIAAGQALVEADYAAALGAIPDGQAKTQGVTLGESAARAILANRATDGAVGPFLNFDCPTNTAPGQYQCTPGTPYIVFEGWANVTPFVLADNSQFRPAPPYSLTSDKYAADFNEVKSLGGDGVTTPSQRTPDQTQIALFWVENSPLKWNRIARTVAARQGLDLWENARLFGLLNVALADGYIAMVATKNHYDFWRPITAIRNGYADGNPDTTGDPNWTPLRGTPADQDYASGHAIEGGAGAEVLKQFFGTDQIRFQDCSTSLDTGNCGDPSPVLRAYSTFSQAANENALSRILVGFHFRKSVEEGTEYGRHIGQGATNLYFRPVR